MYLPIWCHMHMLCRRREGSLSKGHSIHINQFGSLSYGHVGAFPWYFVVCVCVEGGGGVCVKLNPNSGVLHTTSKINSGAKELFIPDHTFAQSHGTVNQTSMYPDLMI
jgi:hypothetical protein